MKSCPFIAVCLIASASLLSSCVTDSRKGQPKGVADSPTDPDPIVREDEGRYFYPEDLTKKVIFDGRTMTAAELFDTEEELTTQLYGRVEVTRTRKWVESPVIVIGEFETQFSHVEMEERSPGQKKAAKQVSMMIVDKIRDAALRAKLSVVDRDSLKSSAREVAVGLETPQFTPGNILIRGKLFVAEEDRNSTFRLDAIDMTTQEVLATAIGLVSERYENMPRIAHKLLMAIRECSPSGPYRTYSAEKAHCDLPPIRMKGKITGTRGWAIFLREAKEEGYSEAEVATYTRKKISEVYKKAQEDGYSIEAVNAEISSKGFPRSVWIPWDSFEGPQRH